MNLIHIYEKMLKYYGKQKWWPVSGIFKPIEWEICIGAVLTQNTNWRNVEKALENMKKACILSPKDVIDIDIRSLRKVIMPSGFFKQKTERLKILASFANNHKDFFNSVTREELLRLKGIGKETADSILLYACNKPFFVIDTYTKRIFSRLGMIDTDDYEEIRNFFESNMEKNPELYNQYHALIVEHAKKFCNKEPLCDECCLKKKCSYTTRGSRKNYRTMLPASPDRKNKRPLSAGITTLNY